MWWRSYTTQLTSLAYNAQWDNSCEAGRAESEAGQAAPRMASARFPGEPGTSPPASKQAAPRALKQTSASFSHVPTILEMKMRGCNAREVRQCSTSCAVCCPVSSEGGRGGRAASAGGECSGTIAIYYINNTSTRAIVLELYRYNKLY